MANTNGVHEIFQPHALGVSRNYENLLEKVELTKCSKLERKRDIALRQDDVQSKHLDNKILLKYH